MRIEFRATDDELSRFRKAAAVAGVGLSDWMRSTLDVAAEQQNAEHGGTLELQKPTTVRKKKETPDR